MRSRDPLIPDGVNRRHVAYCVNRIYSDTTRPTFSDLFEDRVLLYDVDN